MYQEASCMPRVRKVTLSTELVCPSNVLTHVKSATAHSFTVPSPEPVATHWRGRGVGGGQCWGGMHNKYKIFWERGSTNIPDRLERIWRSIHHVDDLWIFPANYHHYFARATSAQCVNILHVFINQCWLTFAVLSWEPETISLSFGETSRELISYRYSRERMS